MELIADILLAAGALGAGFYCFVLGRRLNRFNDLEKGVGGAVAVLSAQVDDLTKTLAAAQTSASQSAKTLTELVDRAEETSRKLELHMASLHDLPEAPATATEPRKAPAPAEEVAAEPAPDAPPAEEAATEEPVATVQKMAAEPVSGPMFVRRNVASKAG